MIDAVSSALVNTQALRNNVEAPVVTNQASVDSVSVPPAAPFIDRIGYNRDFKTSVIEVRDRDTGDVTDQYPSESRLAQRSRVQARVEDTQRTQLVVEPQQAATSTQSVSSPSESSTPAPIVPTVNTPPADIITVQDVTSSASANAPIPSPQIAVAALSAAAQSAQPTPTAGNVSVQA